MRASTNSLRTERKLATREPQRKFKTGKLLIRFASARRGRQLLVVYSEDFLDPRVKRLLRAAASGGVTE